MRIRSLISTFDQLLVADGRSGWAIALHFSAAC